MKKTFFLAIMMCFCICAAAPAQATINKPYDLKCNLSPENMMVSGYFRVEGNFTKGHMGIGISNLTIRSISNLTIFDNSMNETYNYTDVELFIEGGQIMWGINQTMKIAGNTHGILMYQAVEGVPAVAMAGKGGNMNFTGYLENSTLMLQGGRTMVKDRYNRYEYNTSNEYTCTITGNIVASESASVYMIPPDNITIHMTPGASMIDIKDVAGAIGGEGENGGIPQIPKIEMMNGGIFGSVNGSIEIEGKKQNISGITMLRFESADLSYSEGNVVVKGMCKFGFFNGNVHHNIQTVSLFGFGIPLWVFGLWAIAIGVMILSIVLRPIIKKALAGRKGSSEKAPEKEKSDIVSDLNDILKLPALLAHIALVILAFYLFDQEFKYLLGDSAFDALKALTSEINLMDMGSIISLAFGGMALGAWGMMSLLFGTPMKVIASSGFRFFGIAKGARGISKGIGSIIGTYLIGAMFVPWFIGIILPMFINALAGGMG